jgi:hypothetical protein
VEAPAVDGEIDPAIISRKVNDQLGQVTACHERALRQGPITNGKIVVHWQIAAAGSVSGVDIEQDTLGSTATARCLKALVARWRFPRPIGDSVDVSYPFVFKVAL